MRKIVIATFVLTIAAFMPSFAGVNGVNEGVGVNRVNGVNISMSLRAEGAAIQNKDNSCHPERVSGSCTSKNSRILNKFQNDRIFASAKGNPTGFAAEINDDITLPSTNPTDYIKSEYGTEGGVKEKYFKFDTPENNYSLQEVNSKSEADFAVKYAPENYNKVNYLIESNTNPLNENNANNVYFSSYSSDIGRPISNTMMQNQIYNIQADFIENNISNNAITRAATIYNFGTGSQYLIIGNINGVFIKNNINVATYAQGGCILNYKGELGNINADFIDNHACGQYSYGGAILNYGDNPSQSKIKSINGNFIGNSVISTGTVAMGGAISNYNNSNAIIGKIYGNFILNSAISAENTVGGAIENEGLIETINANFYNNFSISNGIVRGGAIANFYQINNICGDFINNYGASKNNLWGGAIYSTGIIGTLDDDGNLTGGIVNSNFYSNYAKSESGTAQGGAIWNSGTIKVSSSEFVGNYTKSDSGASQGGAIKNGGTIGTVIDDKLIGGIENSNFYYNYAKSETGNAQGGAIFTSRNLNIIADNGSSTFKDNYIQVGDGEKEYNAIWVNGESTNLNLQQVNNGKMYMYDNINGTDGYTVNLQGDGTGILYLYNDIKNANVTVDNTTINTANGEVHEYNFNSFHIASNFNFVPDVDLANETMDRITSENVTVADGAKLNVSKLHLMNDATKDVTKITFADSNLAEHVQYTGSKFISYSPIYKYETSYNIEQDENGNPLGRFTFLRSSTSNSESFNPSVLATPVATTAGVYATQLHTFGESFQHSDNYMAMTNSDRTVYKNSNRFAQEGISDVNVFSPLMSASENRGYWVKPYATFERVPLRHGPKVSNIAYGTLIGYDTALTPIKHGFDRVMTYYVGYNGSTQHYNGIDGYQNGGVIGTTISLYKGNFFNATTVSVGASVGEMTTMYGHDYFTSLLAGIGNKTGYNFEFREGKYIIQPNLFLGYSFIKTYDYTNKAGVRIESDPMSAIQISPGIKFIANTKKGWQPYFAINMVWNIFAHNKVMANDVRLPNMSIAPYVQYGLGVQKRFKDRFMAFAQAMVHNGGRNGVALSFGLRWSLGK